MATAKSKSSARGSGANLRSRLGRWLALLIVIVLAALAWSYRGPAQSYAKAATSYGARVACSCRFVADRPLEDCAKDKLAGMEFVTLVDDVEAKSVTARFPLISSDTASYREGFGCVLEPWEE